MDITFNTLKGLKEHFNGSNLQAVYGKIRPYGEVPKEVLESGAPHFTYLLLPSGPDNATKQRVENLSVQVSAWADDFTLAVKMGGEINAILEDKTFTIEGCKCISIDRETHFPQADPDGGWQYINRYTISAQEVI